MTQNQHFTTPDGTRIAYRDHRAPGPAVLLLHGLAGHQGEWDDLTGRLRADGHRVVTYDARGHGASTRRPRSVTREVCVADAAALVEHLSLSAVTLVGQSLGGHTAMLLAAARPDLVSALVLIEAGPGRTPAETPAQIGAWLDSWPRPFKSFQEASDFLGHEGWARGLEEREDGWWPRVDRDVMVGMITDLTRRDHWADWSRTAAPALVIRGADGWLPEEEFEAMPTRRGALTELRTIPAAGHDVHLDQPEGLYAVMEAFMAATSRRTPRS
ncbi:alpha/beta hydrolase [Streptomyces cinnabarinus]|uniref:Alpha/beta hydrolase n=1 Tax=Streptomyces cinnabarinus TaxID=67287 RepID=A0ABY7KBY2_9ACTN|nr:alpha/beta hydrolase [Streptomyces cinnabarinus]WAZ22019.1 alpha/beta hydrolase [Streptomyces cinnabarinus]